MAKFLLLWRVYAVLVFDWSKLSTSILDWLESTGRLIAREGTESSLKFDDEAEELSELMLGDDPSYIDDDDDDDDNDDID